MIDSGFVSCLREELNNAIAGGFVEKVQQPAKDVILMTVRARGQNQKLLLSASPGKARAHLTQMTYESPSEAPMFCMLMRKYYSGAQLTSRMMTVFWNSPFSARMSWGVKSLSVL